MDEEQIDVHEARALSHRADVIDIYSNSWGPPDDGYSVQGPEKMTAAVLEKGTQMVRPKMITQLSLQSGCTHEENVALAR